MQYKSIDKIPGPLLELGGGLPESKLAAFLTYRRVGPGIRESADTRVCQKSGSSQGMLRYA